MHDLWNAAGEQVLKFYKAGEGCECEFRKRNSDDDNKILGEPNTEYQVSFVIDATSSMGSEINNAKNSVKELSRVNHIKKRFRVCFYRDHCDPDEL